MGRDSETSSPFKQKSLPARGSKSLAGDFGAPHIIPPSDTRVTSAEPDSTRPLLQDVYPLAPQQWLVRKKGEGKKDADSLVWKKGYPEMGIVDDTNEGKNMKKLQQYHFRNNYKRGTTYPSIFSSLSQMNNHLYI